MGVHTCYSQKNKKEVEKSWLWSHWRLHDEKEDEPEPTNTMDGTYDYIVIK